MKKKFIAVSSILTLFLLVVTPAFAHVVVRPSQVGVAAYQTYTVGVPNESDDLPTIAVRLLVPEDLEHVSPNVKPGWNIEVKRAPSEEGGDEHGDGKVTEIIWSGGSIPVGMRDEFLFSAKAPANETTLQWKAYQTYAGGRVVSWDKDPKAEQPKNAEGNPDFSEVGPYSETKIVNDLAAAPANANNGPGTTNVASVSNADLASKVNLLMLLSGGALILSIAAIYMQWKKK